MLVRIALLSRKVVKTRIITPSNQPIRSVFTFVPSTSLISCLGKFYKVQKFKNINTKSQMLEAKRKKVSQNFSLLCLASRATIFKCDRVPKSPRQPLKVTSDQTILPNFKKFLTFHFINVLSKYL